MSYKQTRENQFMSGEHPCLCDKCLSARDDELRRAKVATLDDIEKLIPAKKVLIEYSALKTIVTRY